MRNMKEIEKIAKEFTELEESKKENRKNAIDMNLILNSDLKTIKEKYECKYVVDENDNLIFISVNAKPIKGGKIEYSALCYDFIDFLERHNKEVEVVYDPKEEEKEKKACPICGSIITFYPAISRIDNKTEICSDCGVCEAITIYKMSLENKKTDSKN